MQHEKNDDIELLNTVYGTVTMGAGATEHMMKVTDDDALRSQFTNQLKEYRAIEAAALGRLHRLHQTPEGYGSMTKMMSRVGIKMNTALDSTPSHLAEMAIRGAGMGVTEIEGAKNSCPGASDESKHLAEAVIDLEHRCEDGLKQWLK